MSNDINIDNDNNKLMIHTKKEQEFEQVLKQEPRFTYYYYYYLAQQTQEQSLKYKNIDIHTSATTTATTTTTRLVILAKKKNLYQHLSNTKTSIILTTNHYHHSQFYCLCRTTCSTFMFNINIVILFSGHLFTNKHFI